MTGGAGQLIVIWPKQVVIIIIFIWIIKSLYRRISNVYEECVSIIALSLLHGGAHAIIFIYLFFPAERAYTPVIFGRAFCRIMKSLWMERVTTMNQLTDIRNKSAESLKTNLLWLCSPYRCISLLKARPLWRWRVWESTSLLINN